MKIYRSESSIRALVLVFGTGLIGSATARSLERRGCKLDSSPVSHWQDATSRKRQYRELASTIDTQVSANQDEIHLVWSAGSGSFASDAAELRDERHAFEDTLELFETLAGKGRSYFHFVSSAGGLFEGQILVDESASPRPLRPYGEMKLQQEAQLGRSAARCGGLARIFRPSTVYGAHDFRHRAGLISHLMWNAINNRPTTLEANVDALRDYVLVDDVGDYLAGQVLAGSHEAGQVRYLVTGKPSSIFEVVNRVQRMLAKKVLFQYSDRHRNDANITFRSRLMPADWHPTGLEEGLRMVRRATANLRLRGASKGMQY